MSFGWSAATWAAVAGATVSAATAVTANDNARRAGAQAKTQALATAQQADEANNRANAKTPDSAAAMATAILAGKAGNSGTMLTGPQGIDPTQLTLGKASLLGGG